MYRFSGSVTFASAALKYGPLSINSAITKILTNVGIRNRVIRSDEEKYVAGI